MTERREFLSAAIAALFFPCLKSKKPQEIMDDFEEFRGKCLAYSRGHLGENDWEDLDDFLEEGWQRAFEELIENETKIGRFADPPEIFSGCVTAHTAMVMSMRGARHIAAAQPLGPKYNGRVHQYLQEYGEQMLKAYRELV